MTINEEKANKTSPDFLGLYRRYESLDNGLKAALRRVADPGDLRDTAALYRLFFEERPHDNWLRVAFLLPWCEQSKTTTGSKTPSFGALLAAERVNEMRVLQITRAREPLDVICLRRMAIQIKPVVDWTRFGWTLLKWDREHKRQIVEDFYYSKTMQIKKGA